MGSRTQPTGANRTYEDFEPFYEWDRDQRLVNVLLPGYRRDQLKVQVTSNRILRIMGERLIFENNKWRRFNLELPLPSDYDTDNVSAKFEGGTLTVKFGKLLQPEETATTPTQKVEQQKPPQQAEAKETNAEAFYQKKEKTNAEASDQKKEKTNAEASDQKKEETKTETADKVSEEAKTSNGSSETKEATATIPQAPPPTKTGKTVARSKTRLIDFTLSLGPNRDDIGDSDARKNKCKKMVKWMVITYLVVALVGLGFYYARNEYILSPGESDIESYFHEL